MVWLACLQPPAPFLLKPELPPLGLCWSPNPAPIQMFAAEKTNEHQQQIRKIKGEQLIMGQHGTLWNPSLPRGETVCKAVLLTSQSSCAQCSSPGDGGQWPAHG